MAEKFNIWASGFCAFGCLYQGFIEHNISLCIVLGILSLSNLLMGIIGE